jgi:uncharacterized repeat protein (TIGR03803 family)
MSTDWERLKQVLAEAAARNSPAERAAYLDGACRGDDGLRAEVEKLLSAHDQAGAFLEDPVAPTQHSTIVLPAPLTEKPGDKIGHYKLLQQIGEGGCGVVYMAEQEEPIRRRVALKVIKLGMDTKAVIARFEAERQALALMDHPNIAKVLDAGATDTGRPYFVMELVRGIKLTDYCDENNLSTEQRLDLFVQICHAIQHAHQKGVIHRDIKPSNILVMLADDVPVPKVIDFGIAKAIGERLTDKTVYTRFEQFIGTPAYTSPEQAGLSGLDVDTRSDIYSLGVLLYELLMGRTPFEPRALAQAGLEEIIRCIREDEPPKPSTRLMLLEAKEQTTTAQRRATEAPKLIRSLRGDLDWIVMKCLEKNRTRRYATANELARDIECHLSHQPVSAAAPTLGYRTAKYVRRHRRVLATAGALVMLAVLGTMFSVWQARRAEEAEKERENLRNVKWALETALPEIERSLDQKDYTGAFKLVEQARPFIAGNPRFQSLSARAVGVISVETTPPGAQVFIRDYNDLNAKWEPVGNSPLNATKVAQGLKRWKITMPEYESAEGTLFASFKPVELNIKLRLLAPNGRVQTFTTLHSFTATSGSEGYNGTNSDGVHPFLGLLLSGNTLYGAAHVGGRSGWGTVFALNTDGTGFTTLHSFAATSGSEGGYGTNSDGAVPNGGLILSGNTLYGTAQSGGRSGWGTVFAVNTNGAGFTTLHSFAAISGSGGDYGTNSDGAKPYAGLLLSGNTLYGTTQYGGSSGNGTVFAIKTDGTGFTNLYNFTETAGSTGGYGTNRDGANPVGGLILSGNTLYGTAVGGGSSAGGTVFAINTDGTGFTNLHIFTFNDGAYPWDRLILSGNTLYGTAAVGSSGRGTVFAIKTDGTGFTNLHNFTFNDGSRPRAGLILSGNALYGTAYDGGTSGNGTVFAVNTDGTGFTTLHFFAGYPNEGGNPYGLILSGNTLFGMSFNGGRSDNGTVFSLSLGQEAHNQLWREPSPRTNTRSGTEK